MLDGATPDDPADTGREEDPALEVPPMMKGPWKEVLAEVAVGRALLEGAVPETADEGRGWLAPPVPTALDRVGTADEAVEGLTEAVEPTADVGGTEAPGAVPADDARDEVG